MILYTNGCSFTFGDELDNRLRVRWVKLLNDRLNSNNHCDAKGGQSNIDIMNKTMRFDFDSHKHDVLAIIQFTTLLRPNFIGTLNEYYTHVITLQNYFKANDIPYLMLNAFDNQDQINKDDELYSLVDPTYFIDWPHRGITNWVYREERMPKGHPGYKAQEIIAEKIYEEIKRLDIISI